MSGRPKRIQLSKSETVKDESGQNHYAVPPFDDGADRKLDEDAIEDNTSDLDGTSLADNSYSNLFNDLQRECSPDVSPQMAGEILDWLADRGALSGKNRQKTKYNFPKWKLSFLEILRYIKLHPNSIAIYSILHIWDSFELDMINSHLNMTDFAKSIRRTKAAVNKGVQEAAACFGTSPRNDQRKEEARNKMSKTRNSQLL